MTVFNNILDNILGGENLQTPADWYLALQLVEGAMEKWASDLSPRFEVLDIVAAQEEIDKALVFIELCERLLLSVQNDFASEPALLQDWGRLNAGYYTPLQLIVVELCKKFEFGWIEDLIKAHFEKVGFKEP